MSAVRTFAPTNHGDGRADWTFAVAVTFPSAAAMNSPSNEDAIVKRLYPDQAALQEGRAAALRDPRRALGRAPERARSQVTSAGAEDLCPPRPSAGPSTAS